MQANGRQDRSRSHAFRCLADKPNTAIDPPARNWHNQLPNPAYVSQSFMPVGSPRALRG